VEVAGLVRLVLGIVKPAALSPTVHLAEPAAHDPGLNRFIPIVANGRLCPISGLKHAALYRLLVHGPARRHVRVCNLRQPGQARAQTLFHVGDLLAFFSSLAEVQRPTDSAAAMLANVEAAEFGKGVAVA